MSANSNLQYELYLSLLYNEEIAEDQEEAVTRNVETLRIKNTRAVTGNILYRGKGKSRL